jgi:hypothetical protein
MITTISRRNFLRFIGGAAGTAVVFSSVGASKAYATGVKIRLAGESDVGQGGKWVRARAQEWASKTGNQLEYISRPNSSTETLSLYNQYWAAQSPDVDVYLIDVIWPGSAAPHAVDLRKYAQHDVAPRFGHWFSGAEQHLALKAWFDPILAFDLAQGMRLTSLLR